MTNKPITRRNFCELAIGVGASIAAPAIGAGEEKPPVPAAPGPATGTAAPAPGSSDPGAGPSPPIPGDWPTPRQNNRLNTVQPLPGRMRQAPHLAARAPLGRGPGNVQPFASRPGGPVDRAVVIGDGRLRCYDLSGRLRWEIHPPGLNFLDAAAAEDLDGDGRVELLLRAGRPTDPLGAAVLVDADTGRLLFRYDVEPMSYWWTALVGHYLPGGDPKQIVVCEHGYPPDARFGYLALFEFPQPGAAPQQRWRYDFDHFTCFPTILQADVNGDGIREIAVECHSHLWILDPRDGKVLQFLQWDVSPGNERSYGLVRFQDLNGDGLPEFFCIANFAQHQEVLVNRKGELSLAWAHGWDNSVTTTRIATTWPEPPIADVDGDGRLEMLVSMFNADGEHRWMIRIYDAMTGVLKAKVPDRVAASLVDVDHDGRAEILADITRDPTRAAIEGACLLRWQDGKPAEFWSDSRCRAAPTVRRPGEDPTALVSDAVVQEGSTTRLIRMNGGPTLVSDSHHPRARGPVLSHLPNSFGVMSDPPLAADVDGDGRNELIHYRDRKVTVYRFSPARGLVALETIPSDGAPVMADVDGDGRLEMLVGSAGPDSDSVVRALRLGRDRKELWSVTLKKPDRVGLPYGKPLYFQTGRFTGRRGDDLYVYVGTPIVRSVMLSGRDGSLLWEKGEIPGLERYFAPTVNLASVWDFDGDGQDDLVFTCPDYYCVAKGATGEALLGPLFPPKIFQQPSQGLYTLPAVLPSKTGDPTICLVDGHYFQAAMSLHASPYWYHLPITGQAHAGAEGFLQTREGRWLMGFGRQDGIFACLDALTGKQLWEYPLEATASDVCSCDINNDGEPEFLFGTSHGHVYALAGRPDSATVVWKASLDAGVGAPIAVDLDGDGHCEIAAVLGDGHLCVLRQA